MSDRKCRLCGSDTLSECLRLKNSPASIQRLPLQKDFESDKAIELVVYKCEACGMVQLADSLDCDYYEDYVMTTSHSQQMQNYQKQQAAAFVERFGLQGKRVAEVGCGDGNYMVLLQSLGATAFGVEPSRPFRTLAEEKGLEVAAGYVGTASLIPGAPYDAFVTRQVLEHVPAPNDFLEGIMSSLTESGVGLIEVPSLEQAIENGRFYDFFPDHMNYFSSQTLRFALERNGFEVVDIQRGMFGEYLVAHVRKAQPRDISVLQRTVDNLTQDIRQFVASNGRVAVWGAGGKGNTAIAVANTDGIAYVVDSDPHKHGRYTPVSHLPIFAPERLLSDPVDAVILTALAYKNEILNQIRNDLKFKGTIALLGKRLTIAQENAEVRS